MAKAGKRGSTRFTHRGRETPPKGKKDRGKMPGFPFQSKKKKKDM